MELGAAKLKESGTNYILHAVHPQHGLIWTDGKTLFLTPVNVSNSELLNGKSFKIGEFDIVREVSWSADCGSHSCYLCVAHREKVAIWKVSGSVPKLGFKQVRKINILTIQQGICWNPKGDLLCLLSKNQCCFYHSHSGKKQSYALPPFESENIRCATWTLDGQKLVVCVGQEILVYRWSDIESNPKEFTEFSFDLSEPVGSIVSMIALPGDRIVFATELSLQHQLKKPEDVYIAPSLSKTPSFEQSENIGDLNCVSPVREDNSAMHSLMNVQNGHQFKNNSSELVLIDLDERGNIINRCNIENVLKPNLICYEPDSQAIITTSCSHRIIQIYSSQLVKVDEIILDKLDRPRGLCSMRCISSEDNGLLVLVERKKESNDAFLSTSPQTADISLKFYSMATGHVNGVGLKSRNEVKQNGDIPGKPARKFKKGLDEYQRASFNSSQESHQSDSSLRSPTAEVTTDESGNSLLIPGKSIVIPNTESIVRSSVNGSLIEELDKANKNSHLEYESVEFSESQPKFKNVQMSNGDINGNTGSVPSRDVSHNSEKENRGPKSPTKVVTEAKMSKHVVKRKTDSDVANVDDNATARYEPVFNLRKYDILHSSTSSLTSKGDTLEYTDHSKEQVVKQYDNAVCASQTLLSKSMTVTMSADQGQISEYPFLQKQLSLQTKQIEELFLRLTQLAQLVEESSCVFPTKYQAASSPELVHIALVKDKNMVKKKTFLLDDGRIQLEPVKRVFKLDTVDVILDGEPITVGANIDGYIPLRFDPGSTVFICGRHSTSH